MTDTRAPESFIDETDTFWLGHCLRLARRAAALSNPNPRVGAVIVMNDSTGGQDRILGEGYTQMAGEAHAEVMALQSARQQGHAVQGATMYVSLEPCSHHGRTPPCADAIIEAGIARVVVCTLDPNPEVAGRGVERMREAGIQVDCGALHNEAQSLNAGFFKRMTQGMPWVRMKMATSLDGFSALPSGESQWITGEAARVDGHQWRARACVVLTGIGTVLADDPLLNARLPGLMRQPHVALVDSNLRLPLDAALLMPELRAQRQTCIYTTKAAYSQQAEKVRALEDMGVQVVALESDAGQPLERVPLEHVLSDLAQRVQVNEVHVESGATLAGALLREGLVDELLCYVAPRLLLHGRGWVAQHAEAADWLPTSLSETHDFTLASVQQVGNDCRMLLQRKEG